MDRANRTDKAAQGLLMALLANILKDNRVNEWFVRPSNPHAVEGSKSLADFVCQAYRRSLPV